mgnify:CR=1 FL=1
MTDDESEWTTDRGRGILTPADRLYLLGYREYDSDQSERDARYRIRNRVVNSVRDFAIIYEHLSDEDFDQIEQDLNEEDVEAMARFVRQLDIPADVEVELEDLHRLLGRITNNDTPES